MKQTDIKASFHLIPPSAIQAVSEVLYQGEIKYGRDNWKTIDLREHINHAVAHLYGALAASSEEQMREELSHSACRVLFALALVRPDFEFR